MFKKKFDNTTAAPVEPIPVSDTTINHNYAPSRVGAIFAGFIVIVAALWLLPQFIWWGLVFLAQQAGYMRPERAAAECLIGLFILLCLIGVFVPVAKWLLNDFYQFRQVIEDKKIEFMREQTRQLQLAPPSTSATMTYDDTRKYLVIKLVMDKTYHQGYIDDKGKLLTKSQPWSVRQVGAMVLPGEKSPIGKDSALASWVAGYLLDRRILLDERSVNMAGFPDLASVEARLVSDFGRPISYSGSGSDFAMSGQYINKGGNGGSFT